MTTIIQLWSIMPLPHFIISRRRNFTARHPNTMNRRGLCHAAHQALLAHGHALRAIGRGSEAARLCRACPSGTVQSAGICAAISSEAGRQRGEVQPAMSAAGHHAAAADHNDQAAAIMRRQPGISKNMKRTRRS